MKKFLKIFGITLLSLLGLSVIVFLVAIWLVFTPARLTPIVRKQADKYITSQHEIGEVDLAFFKTFPKFGIKISHLLILNPVEGAQSDTLLYMNEMVASIDAKALWKNNEIIVDKLWARGLMANAFFGEDGVTNLDVFNLPESDEPEEEEVETEFPFASLNMDKAGFYEINLTYLDLSSGMKAAVRAINAEAGLNYKDKKADGKINFGSDEITATMELDTASVMTVRVKDISSDIILGYFEEKADVDFKLKTSGVWVGMDGEQFLAGAPLRVSIPLVADLDKMSFDINDAKLAIEKIGLGLSGNIVMEENDNIAMDILFGVDKLAISDLLAMVPASYTSMLEGMEVDGFVVMSGNVKGIFNDSLMPVVEANLLAEKMDFSYSELPISFYGINGDIDAYVDMNDEKASYANINKASLRTGSSYVEASGRVNEVLGDNMKINIAGNLDLLLSDFKDFVPEGMSVDGRVTGPVKARLSMSQLERMDFEAMSISGSLGIKDLIAVMDTTINANSSDMKVDFTIPSGNPEATLVKVKLYDCEGIDVRMIGDIEAALRGVSVIADVSNIIADTTSLTAVVKMGLESANGSMEDIAGNLSGLDGNVKVVMDMIDTVAMPTVEGTFAMRSLEGSMDTIHVNVNQPGVTLAMSGTPRDKGQIMASINYQNASLNASAGDYSVNTGMVRLSAGVEQDSLASNILSQWNPMVSLNMNEANVHIPDINENIAIPVVIFDMNKERILINEGRFNIGPSDFRLTGTINNIVEYMDDEGLLQGELDFTSGVTDVNYFMDMVSGFGVTEDSLAVEEEIADTSLEEANPFMVPMGVDLVLNTKINTALVGEQTVSNLGGKLYVKDGILVLEEMGFVSKATRLQMTAMYRSPRKNHLFVGLDYHMLDVRIEELVKMIPDIDTVMPMLKVFHGNGEFHMAIETYLDAGYNPKLSTLRGAASIKGEDLVVMDSTIFKKIRRWTLMGRKTENKIDSINAEITVFREEVDVYPLMVTMGRYQGILGGRHNLNMTYDYHMSLTESPLPFRLGVNVFTNKKNKLKVLPARTQYAPDYKPKRWNVVDQRQRELRAIIRESLTANVREEEATVE